MFLSKKQISVFLAFTLLLQQGVFASQLNVARALDARRFAVKKVDSGEAVKLENDAFERLEKFNKKTKSSWRIRMNRATKHPRSLVGGENIRVGSGDRGALKFLKSNKDFLGVDVKTLKLARKPLKSAVGTHYYFKQYYKNLPVDNAYVKVNVDKNGALINYQSTYIPNLDINVNGSVSASQAASTAAQDAGGIALKAAEKVIYVKPDTNEASLAWKVLVQGGDKAPAKWDYYIDAESGAVLNRISKLLYAAKDAKFQIDINPVYPNAPGISSQKFPLKDMYVYSFDASGAASAPVTTDASGKVSASGRMWTTYSGPYFTVTNQRNVTNYYVEKGDNETFSTNDWTVFDKGSDWSTINACDTGYWPVFSYPLINSFNLGAMNSAGEISDKKFLLLGSELPKPLTLGAYIGKFTSLNGPLVSNYDTQKLTVGAYPAGYVPGVNEYSIIQFKKLCVPTSAPERYSNASGALDVTLATDNVPNPEAVTFYNLNAMRDFFVTLAGADFDLSGHIPVMVNASGSRYQNSNDGMMNAFYDLDANLILIGEGAYDVNTSRYRNFAFESSIVRHEYVHAVMNKIWPIIYFDEGAAISEAVSDYFALSSIKDATGKPYTSIIGAWVGGTSGEGMARNLDGTNSYTAEKWVQNGAPMGQHANSLFLSQALWDLRKLNSGATIMADKLVWNALMFFPDSLLEFRDAMVATAKILDASLVPQVESVFDAHGITYDNIITAKGDIYEPNNGPNAAADIDIASISKKTLQAKINPASDIDYYSISLPEGEFKAELYLPVIKKVSASASYMPLGMLLLDANMQTAVDLVRPADVPDDQIGNTGITTSYEKITLTFNAPALLSGNTGRYILGVYRLNNAFYPATSEVTEETGAYTLKFTFASGSNVGDVQAQYDDLADGRIITFKVPLGTTKDNGLATSLTPLGLDYWAPVNYEFFHSARLLDSDMNPIPGASTADGPTGYLFPEEIRIHPEMMGGDIKLQNNFAALGHDVVYLQIFGVLRSIAANAQNPNPNYREDYGIVSMGISNPIFNKHTPGNANIYIKEAVFNPMKGGKLKMKLLPKEDGHMKIQLFTIDGLLVKTLLDADVQQNIAQIIEWAGDNGGGKTVASGVYLLRIDGAGIDRDLRKIVVVK